MIRVCDARHASVYSTSTGDGVILPRSVVLAGLAQQVEKLPAVLVG
jgi:hypothetical protein